MPSYVEEQISPGMKDFENRGREKGDYSADTHTGARSAQFNFLLDADNLREMSPSRYKDRDKSPEERKAESDNMESFINDLSKGQVQNVREYEASLQKEKEEKREKKKKVKEQKKAEKRESRALQRKLTKKEQKVLASLSENDKMALVQ